MSMSFEDHLTPFLHEFGAAAAGALEHGRAEAARIGDETVAALTGATPQGRTKETGRAWHQEIHQTADALELHITIPGVHSGGKEFNQIVDWLEEGNHANNADGFIHPTNKRAIFWEGAAHPVSKVRPMQGHKFVEETFNRATDRFEERVGAAIEKALPS